MNRLKMFVGPTGCELMDLNDLVGAHVVVNFLIGVLCIVLDCTEY